MNNQNSKCCEKCTGERNPTMMCQSIFCPCHTTSKSEECIHGPVFSTTEGYICKKCGEMAPANSTKPRLENWEEKITDILGLEKVDEEWCLITRDEDDNMVEYVEWSGEVKEIKVFISTLLQEEREKAYKQGWKDGCNELLEGRFDTRF